MSTTGAVASPRSQADADAVVAVGLARTAVAEAVLVVAHARRLAVAEADRTSVRRAAVLRGVHPMPELGRRIRDEVSHVVADRYGACCRGR